jgi:hypothetical protein
MYFSYFSGIKIFLSDNLWARSTQRFTKYGKKNNKCYREKHFINGETHIFIAVTFIPAFPDGPVYRAI